MTSTIKGHVSILNDKNELVTENNNMIVYAGREHIFDMIYGTSIYKLRGFSVGTNGVLNSNPMIPTNISLKDKNLINVIPFVTDVSSENLTNNKYIKDDNNLFTIKQINPDFISKVPDINNDGYYLITKILIPIRREECNGASNIGAYLNEYGLWLINDDDNTKKILYIDKNRIFIDI